MTQKAVNQNFFPILKKYSQTPFLAILSNVHIFYNTLETFPNSSHTFSRNSKTLKDFKFIKEANKMSTKFF